MSTPNGPMPFQDWTCPHCAAVWHSGRQYCVDCGYGLELLADQIRQEVTQRQDREANHQGGSGASASPHVQAEARAGAPEALARSTSTGPAFTETRQLQEALARSMAAESAVQAEVAVLRERSTQLQAQLDEQRRVFVSGVSQMMKPLDDYFAASGVQVPFESLIPEALTRLEQGADLQAEVERLRAETKTLRRPVEVRRVGVEVAELRALSERLSALEQQVAAHLPLGGDPSRDPEPSGGYDTFVMSDRASADIERAILGAQTRGQRYGG